MLLNFSAWFGRFPIMGRSLVFPWDKGDIRKRYQTKQEETKWESSGTMKIRFLAKYVSKLCSKSTKGIWSQSRAFETHTGPCSTRDRQDKGPGGPDNVRHPYPGHSSSQDIARNLSYGNVHKHVMWSKSKDDHPPLRNVYGACRPEIKRITKQVH